MIIDVDVSTDAISVDNLTDCDDDKASNMEVGSETEFSFNELSNSDVSYYELSSSDINEATDERGLDESLYKLGDFDENDDYDNVANDVFLLGKSFVKLSKYKFNECFIKIMILSVKIMKKA